MPQMMPLNWLSLYLMFIMLFVFLNIMNFYCFHYKTPSFKVSVPTSKITWKW